MVLGCGWTIRAPVSRVRLIVHKRDRVANRGARVLRLHRENHSSVVGTTAVFHGIHPSSFGVSCRCRKTGEPGVHFSKERLQHSKYFFSTSLVLFPKSSRTSQFFKEATIVTFCLLLRRENICIEIIFRFSSSHDYSTTRVYYCSSINNTQDR